MLSTLFFKRFIVFISIVSLIFPFFKNNDVDLKISDTKVVKVVACDENFACLDIKGNVYVWGNYPFPDKMQPPEDLPQIIDIAIGANHVVALDKNGKLHGWGNAQDGEIKFGENLPKFVSIAAASNQTTALTANGMVYKWGKTNNSGQKYVPSNMGKVTQIANGKYITSVITSDGKVYLWGITDGAPPVCKDPVMLAPLEYNTVVLGSDGKIYGKIKHMDTMYKHKQQPQLGKIVRLFSGNSNLAAIDDKGLLTIWGDYKYFANGQCIVDIPTNLPPVKSVAFGVNTIVCLGLDGKVYQWGEKLFTIPQEINGFIDSLPEFNNAHYAQQSTNVDVYNSTEFLEAIQSDCKTITVKNNIRITGHSLFLDSNRTIIINNNVKVSIETENFSVLGTIINNGQISVYGRIMFNSKLSQLGNMRAIDQGEITYSCGNATLNDIKKYLSEDSIYTSLFTYSTTGDKFYLVIDEDYTLPAKKNLRLSRDCTLIISGGVTLIVKGNIDTNNKPVIIGTLVGEINYET